MNTGKNCYSPSPSGQEPLGYKKNKYWVHLPCHQILSTHWRGYSAVVGTAQVAPTESTASQNREILLWNSFFQIASSAPLLQIRKEKTAFVLGDVQRLLMATKRWHYVREREQYEVRKTKNAQIQHSYNADTKIQEVCTNTWPNRRCILLTSSQDPLGGR